MASLTYVSFVPAKGLIRGLSANSSNIAFKVPLASKKPEKRLKKLSSAYAYHICKAWYHGSCTMTAESIKTSWNMSS